MERLRTIGCAWLKPAQIAPQRCGDDRRRSRGRNVESGGTGIRRVSDNAHLSLARLWPFVIQCVGTEAFVCCHRALVAGSAAEVFACRLEHPKCEKSNRHLFPQALRSRAWHRRAKVELRAIPVHASLAPRHERNAICGDNGGPLGGAILPAPQRWFMRRQSRA